MDRRYRKLEKEAKDVCTILKGIAIEVEVMDCINGVYVYTRC